jgi:curved DNA-binding protein CbpA
MVSTLDSGQVAGPSSFRSRSAPALNTAKSRQSSGGENGVRQETAITDIYAALGVDYSASPDEIRKAFYVKASAFHPDRNPGDEIAAEIFKTLAKGAEILRDPRTRQLYDRGEIDHSGRLTTQGVRRRRRVGMGKVVAAYFLVPFAAGVTLLSAALWAQSQNLLAISQEPPPKANVGAMAAIESGSKAARESGQPEGRAFVRLASFMGAADVVIPPAPKRVKVTRQN